MESRKHTNSQKEFRESGNPPQLDEKPVFEPRWTLRRLWHHGTKTSFWSHFMRILTQDRFCTL